MSLSARLTEIMELSFFNNSRIKTSTTDHFSTYTNEFTANQTAVTIATPTAGKRLIPHNIGLSTEGNSGKVLIYWATSGKPIAALYPSQQANASYFGIANQNGAIDEVIKITSTTGDNDLFVGIDYEEV